MNSTPLLLQIAATPPPVGRVPSRGGSGPSFVAQASSPAGWGGVSPPDRNSQTSGHSTLGTGPTTATWDGCVTEIEVSRASVIRVPPRGALLLFILSFATLALSARAQSDYTEVSRGPHSRLMQRVLSSTDDNGNIILTTNSYLELASGLSVKNSAGEWVSASENISITPDGGAATNLQHIVRFAANINTRGAISLTPPGGPVGGRILRSTPLFMSFSDGTNVSVIGELQDSIGQLISSDTPIYSTNTYSTNGQTSGQPVSNNRVLYTNVFNGVSADLLYSVGRARFEQDVVMRQQLPTPNEALGPRLKLQIWTEFSEAISPQIDSETNAAVGMVDQSLNFGTLHMSRGHAFVAGDGTPLTPTFKRWKVLPGDGTNPTRTFLVEEIPLAAILADLQDLPPYTGKLYTPPSGSSPRYANLIPDQATPPGFGLRQPSAAFPPRNQTSTTKNPTIAQIPPFTLPPPRLAAKKDQPLLLAKSPLFQRGFVIDYTTINNSLTNFIFSSDKTFYVSGALDLYGTTTIEGGAVIKTGATNAGTTIHSNLVCLTSPWNPAIFTSKHVDTIGAQISGSTGNNNIIVTTPLYCVNSCTVSNLRFSYVFNAFSAGGASADVWDCQFVNCTHPLTANSGTTNLGLHNVLICMTNTINSGGLAFTLYSTGLTIRGEHVTADLGPASYVGFTSSQLSYFDLTNSIIQATNLLYCTSGTPSVSTTTNSVYYSSVPNSGLFQSVGAANYFLANNSPYRSLGAANLSAAMLADVAAKTTYPPVFLTNTFTNDTILSPEAPRGNPASPDYGYGYDPVDFVGYCAVSNANLIMTNGVVFAYFGGGIWLQNGGKLISQGSPTQPNRIIYFNLASEQSANLWSPTYTAANAVLNSIPFSLYETNLTQNRTINLRFTTVSGAQSANYCMYATTNNWVLSSLLFQDCEIDCAGAKWLLSHGTTAPPSITWSNCVFPHAYVALTNGGPLIVDNCLFTGTNQTVVFSKVGTPTWIGANNAFDGPAMATLDTGFQYEAFLNGTAHGTLHTGDLATTLAWVAGPLGAYYQPATSGLIAVGSTYATNLGLFHYTSAVNQVPLGTNKVTIGYLYMALGTNGLPLSTSGDGLGNYLKDSNGNGAFDPGVDLGNWTTATNCPTDGVSDYIKWLQGRSLTICGTNADTTGIIGLQVYTPLK